MYILVPEASGEVKTNTYYEGGYAEWQGRDRKHVKEQLELGPHLSRFTSEGTLPSVPFQFEGGTSPGSPTRRQMPKILIALK